MTKVLGKYVIINKFDIGKTTQDLLRDLLYESTGSRIPKDKIIYGKPRALDQRPSDKYDPNTFIPVTVDIVYDTRFRSDGDGFMYRRRSIIEHTSGVDFTKISPEFFPFRISDIIDQINSYLEYPIAMSEVVEYEYTTAAQWAKGIRLQARDDSYLWMDGQTITIDTTLISHENLLSNNILNGFNIYQPPNGPYVIDGFAEHRGGCDQVTCPICSPTGIITPDTPQHIVDYVNMTQREVNPSYSELPVMTLFATLGNELQIRPPTETVDNGSFGTLPPESDDRPQPVVDGEVSPYHSFTQSVCGEEVNLEYYAPRIAEPEAGCRVEGEPAPYPYPEPTAGSCSGATNGDTSASGDTGCTDSQFTPSPVSTCGNC